MRDFHKKNRLQGVSSEEVYNLKFSLPLIVEKNVIILIDVLTNLNILYL